MIPTDAWSSVNREAEMSCIDPVSWQRCARRFYLWRIPVIPKLITYMARFTFGCWIPHTADIGSGCRFGYGGLSVVIHSNAKLGRNVHVDQQVTIGGNGTCEGVPIIGDDVYIGCGAKILGPVQIGDGSVIGANAVVLTDIPARSVAVGAPARVVKHDIDIHEFLQHLRSANWNEINE